MNIYGVLSLTTGICCVPKGENGSHCFQYMDKVLSDLEKREVSISAIDFLSLDIIGVTEALLKSNIPQRVKDLIHFPPPFNFDVYEQLHQELGEF